MKKILILLLFFVIASCQPDCTTIIDVKLQDSSYTVLETVTHSNGHPGVGTVVGATAGYLLTGGLLGVVGGGIVGNSVSDHSISTYTRPVIHTIYRTTYYLSDSTTDYKITTYPYHQQIGDCYHN